MARRPVKASEGHPEQFFDLRKEDGSRLSLKDIVTGQAAIDIPLTVTPRWMINGRPLPGVDLQKLPEISERLEKFLGNVPSKETSAAVLQVIEDYILNRAVEIDGANEVETARAVAEIGEAAYLLKEFLDNSRNRPEISAAWRRIDEARAPFGDKGEPTHDTAYSGLSRLVARLIALEGTEANRKTAQSSDSFRTLTQTLSAILTAAGREPTASNDESGGKRSAFENLVVTCLDAVPLPPPFEKLPFTDAALKKRIERALSDRRQ